MRNDHWILRTVLLIATMVLLSIGFMMFTDVYGLFRSSQGRGLPIYYADRMGKSLLNLHYVPTNFDSLLIGPSSSVNWESPTITSGIGLHLYNESLEGGNATEEKLFVDRAIQSGHFKVAILVLNPTMITSHTYHEGLDQVRWTEALGSLDAYIQTLLSELTIHHHKLTSKQNSLADGSHEMRTTKADLSVLQTIDYTQDPVGMQNFSIMAKELQDHGVKLVYVAPAVYDPVLRANPDGFPHFIASLLTILPNAPLIDLNAPEYTNFRSNPDNFMDSFHVSPQGATKISQILNQRLRAILHENSH